MTKPDERIPATGKGEIDKLRELRRVLGQLEVITASALGTLAYKNTVGTPELDDTAVTLGKIANISTNRILGRTTAGTGVSEELTPTQVTAMLDAFTSGLKGLVPASGGGTTNYMRADGTWAQPPGTASEHPVTTRLLGSDHSVASTTATKVTDLDHALVAGTYTFQYFLMVQSTSTSVGMKFGINYTGTMERFVVARRMFTSGQSAANGQIISHVTTPSGRLVEHSSARLLSSTAPNLGPNASFVGANVDCQNIIEGVITVANGGNLELWHGSETATATSVEVGSALVLTKIG